MIKSLLDTFVSVAIVFALTLLFYGLSILLNFGFAFSDVAFPALLGAYVAAEFSLAMMRNGVM